jgi:hypothetical protein
MLSLCQLFGQQRMWSNITLRYKSSCNSAEDFNKIEADTWEREKCNVESDVKQYAWCIYYQWIMHVYPCLCALYSNFNVSSICNYPCIPSLCLHLFCELSYQTQFDAMSFETDHNWKEIFWLKLLIFDLNSSKRHLRFQLLICFMTKSMTVW